MQIGNNHGFLTPSTAVLKYLSRALHTSTLSPTAHTRNLSTCFANQSLFSSRPRLSTWSHDCLFLKSRHIQTHAISSRRSHQSSRSFTRRNLSISNTSPSLLSQPTSSLTDDPPFFPSFSDDPPNAISLSSRILSKPLPDLRLRCTEFDVHGNVTLVNSEFKKSELIAKYGLQPRDLRKIDNSSSLLPTILVRDRAILLNLLHIRCLIQADRVLVFDAYGSTDSYTQSLFMYDLEGRLAGHNSTSGQLKDGVLPYEFRALEAVLISVTTALENEFEGVRGPVVRVLRDLEENIDREQLRLLLVLSKKLGTFEQKARLVRDALDELLEADDDLADMYLSEKKMGVVREEDGDHTDVEMLLESYDKVCDEIVQVSGNLVSNIRNTEEIIKAILDANRNSLMLLDLKFSIGTLGLGVGTFIAALYGMNLKSYIEEVDWGFPLVSGMCGIFTAIACTYGLRKLRRVQRLSMHGEGEFNSGKKRSAFDLKRGNAIMSGGEDMTLPDATSTKVSKWGTSDVAATVEKLEKTQWKTAERLRRMKMAERTRS